MASYDIQEEIKLLTGKGMWHTSESGGVSIHLSDGPHGLRKQEEGEGRNNISKAATCFPSASAVASSWNIEIASLLGKALAREAWNEDISVLLGPGINIKRSPLCGRNFEYFSEDPFLTAMMGDAYVKAVQKEGIAVSLKHFAANSQETNRQTSNSQVDERALREIYLSAFEYIVKSARPASVMASYNRLNGVWATENEWLLTKVLRGEWGFDGIVISDWGACIDLVKAVKAGLDLEMPDSLSLHGKQLKNALEEGEITEDEILCSSKRVRAFVDKWKAVSREKKDTSSSHIIAKEILLESAVLLKNDGILPLKEKDVVVIGSMAKKMRFQGGGSSHVNTEYAPDAVKALEKRGVTVTYAPGYTLHDRVNKKMEDEAVCLASSGKTVLFFGGLTDEYEGEGFDRKSLDMPSNQLRLLKRIAEVNKSVVFVSSSGAPYDMAFEDSVNAILQLYLGGEAVDEAVADLLLGVTSPSGKTAESWPYNVSDTPSYGYYATGSDDVEYRESIFVGYRYYETYNIPVRFPFGYGLSYTSFEYSNLSLEKDGKRIVVSLDVRNTGKMAGSEIVELYVGNPGCDYLRSKKELRGFKKVKIERGECKRLVMTLDERSFSIYDNGRFLVPEGEYRIMVGPSSNNILLSSTLEIKGEEYTRNDRERLSFYFKKNLHSVTKEQFALLYGKPLSSFSRREKGDYGRYNSLKQLSEHSLLARLLIIVARPLVYTQFKKVEKNDPEIMMMMEGITHGTIESVMCQSKGVIPPRLVDAMVLSANGKKWKALKKLFEREKRK